MEKILDLGCGTGDSWRGSGLQLDGRCVVGIDIRPERVRAANGKYNSRGWHYLCARGEEIPLADRSIDGVFCEVALPYMHIPHALAEIYRVLVPGGWLRATLHVPEFTYRELLKALPKPKASSFRVFVLLNGVVFHFTGNVISLGRVAESCQTENGMRIALLRAGFQDITFRREGLRFFSEARRVSAPSGSEPTPEVVTRSASR